ncbi:MAG: YCF48-related protein [Bacteroidales bacterium]
MKKNLTTGTFRIAILVLSGILFTSICSYSQLILKHPRNAGDCAGIATIEYSVSADTRSYTNVTYLWQYQAPRTKIWLNVPAELGKGTETQSTLTMQFNKLQPLTTDLNNFQFRCMVKGTLAFTKLTTTEYSNSAYLYVYTKPSISSQPSGATKFVGESVTFSVSASSTLAKSYQWQKGGVDIAGATSSSYTLSSVSLSDNGLYRCRVSNNCGFSYSNDAELIVNDVEFGDGWVEQISPTSQDIRMVDAVSNYIAWAITGDTDRLLKTTDGGETWTAFQTGRASSYWQSIDMINQNLIFIGGYQVVGRTVDGGGSWTFYDVYSELGLDEYTYIYDLQFIDANIGYGVGRGGLIIKTNNGGTSWIKQNWKNDPDQVTDVDLRGVYFLNANLGWTVGENGVILKTTNGGSSWTKLPSFNTTPLKGIWFTDANTGYATGRGSYRHLIKTTDGGTSWVSLSTNLPQSNPQDIQFINQNEGYITGQLYNYESSSYEGSVLKTIDGGDNWYAQKVENANQLYGIFMLDEENGWVVGDAGEIQRTATGGCLNPTVNLYSDQSFCASGSYTLVADSFENNMNCFYEWNTGETTGQITVNSTDTYSVTVTNLCGVTTNDDVNINVFDLPEADAGEDKSICPGDTTQLIATGGISYSWNNSQWLSADDIQNPTCFPPQGITTFTVTVIDENGCVNTDEVNVNIGYPYEGEEICIVTIDLETGKNMVVWEKTYDVGIASYNIYRLGTGGVYNLIGSVAFDSLSVFVDETSEPEKTQYLYKLSAVDSCGGESSKSHYHKTLFLQYTSSEGGVNLLWQDYEIEDEFVDFSDFYIFRGTDSTALTVIDTVSGTNVYTDTDPEANTKRMYYRVAGVKPEPCDPAGLLGGKKAGSGPFVHSLSNLEDNRLQTGMDDLFAIKTNFQVFPNPFSTTLRVHFRLDEFSKVRLELYNILGERMKIFFDETLAPMDHDYQFQRDDFSAEEGLYYLRLWVNDRYVTRKVILNR